MRVGARSEEEALYSPSAPSSVIHVFTCHPEPDTTNDLNNFVFITFDTGLPPAKGCRRSLTYSAPPWDVLITYSAITPKDKHCIGHYTPLSTSDRLRWWYNQGRQKCERIGSHPTKNPFLHWERKVTFNMGKSKSSETVSIGICPIPIWTILKGNRKITRKHVIGWNPRIKNLLRTWWSRA